MNYKNIFYFIVFFVSTFICFSAIDEIKFSGRFGIVADIDFIVFAILSFLIWILMFFNSKFFANMAILNFILLFGFTNIYYYLDFSFKEKKMNNVVACIKECPFDSQNSTKCEVYYKYDSVLNKKINPDLVLDCKCKKNKLNYHYVKYDYFFEEKIESFWFSRFHKSTLCPSGCDEESWAAWEVFYIYSESGYDEILAALQKRLRTDKIVEKIEYFQPIGDNFFLLKIERSEKK